MKWARSIAFAAIAASALTSCLNSSMDSGGRHDPLSAASNDRNATLAGGDDCGGLPTAPESLRVDLIDPSFSDPLAGTNPLFPVGELDRAILLGLSDGEPFRTETTRLPGTQVIIIDGKPVQTIISQYVAWLDRRIYEVALDWYGQDDEGNMWYFGEDVFNYEDGVVVDMDGTWLAGVDGPVAMIMPADPHVGDVWRPENACPIVFEEVTAIETGVTVEGPSGPVSGVLRVSELHMDGGLEEKLFAPGYGEFSTGSAASGNLEALAVAVPTDFLGGEVPEDLDDLGDDAERLFRLGRNGSWRRIRALIEEMREDWQDYEATGVPPLLAEQMNTALFEELQDAIDARERSEVRQGAVDVALACVDFELLYEERSDIELDLIEVWSLQLQIDTAAHDDAGILSDLETIRLIRDRLDPAVRSRIESDLSALSAAAKSRDEGAVEAGADKLQQTMAQLAGGASR